VYRIGDASQKEGKKMTRKNDKNGSYQRKYGKDDMNLVEFPFSTLSARSNEKMMVVEREEKDKKGLSVKKKWKVTGHLEYGLPKPSTMDLFLVLLELAKEQSNFTDIKVYFSRSEIFRRMNVSNDGRNYNRLIQDFEILKAVGITYTNSFWHNKRKSNLTIGTGILQNYQIFDETGSQEPLFQSYATFNEEYFNSLQFAYIKNLDSNFYFSLNAPVTKKLYRVLDKRFYGSHKLYFDLKDLAFSILGLSDNYNTAQIKRKLNKAHKELKDKNFCTHEYEKIKRGVWRVWYYKTQTQEEKTPEEKTDVYQMLLDYGIVKNQVDTLKEQKENILDDPVKSGLDFDHFSFEDYLKEKIEILEYMKRTQDVENEAGFLWKAIMENYQSKPLEKEKREQLQRKKVKQKKAQQKAKEKQDLQAKIEQEEKERQENETLFNTLTDQEKMEIFQITKKECPFSNRIGFPQNAEEIEIILDNKILFSHYYFKNMKTFIKNVTTQPTR
jgi:hypothetical protein